MRREAGAKIRSSDRRYRRKKYLSRCSRRRSNRRRLVAMYSFQVVEVLSRRSGTVELQSSAHDEVEYCELTRDRGSVCG